MNYLLLIACSILSQVPAPTTSRVWDQSDLGLTAIFPMQAAPYPHASRENGFKNGQQSFPRDPHYIDNSVAFFIPKSYLPGERVDLLVYFHGHNNNLRKALDQFKLREQIVASGQNVILVFPEGPKDAADSGCGKLEEPGGLKRLTDEVLDTLAAEGKTTSKRLGLVLLAGHSGAYRVLSCCVQHGGLEDHVAAVGLLDSSYGQLDNFVDWAKRKPDARLFSIFTDHLAAQNVYLMTHLHKQNLAYALMDDQDATPADLAKNRILFLHTQKLKHDETVSWLENWLKAVGSLAPSAQRGVEG
jgi:hypothetical protein